MDPDWCEAISRRLKPGGMLIFNMIEPDKVPHFPIIRDVLLAKRFPERIMYQIDGYENRVLAFCDQVFDGRRLKENLEQIMKSHPRCRGVEARSTSVTCSNLSQLEYRILQRGVREGCLATV